MSEEETTAPDPKPEPEKPLSLEQRIDAAAAKLLDLIDNEKTSDVQKGRLFAQVVAWHAKKQKKASSEEGSRLKEMAHELKTGSGKREGSPKSGKPDDSGDGGRTRKNGHRRNRDGEEIRSIIGNLPAYGVRPAGDPSGAERSSGGHARHAGGAGADRVRDE